MKIKTLCTVIALSVSSGMVWAAPYQAEIGAAYIDFQEGMETKAVLGEWHFAPVATDGHPLAEAAFLERSSSVSAVYTMTEYEIVDTEVDIDVAILNFNYYVPNTIFYIGATYQRVSFDLYPAISGSENDWGLTLGITPIDGLLISTNYMNDPGYNFNLAAKYVYKLQGETAINIDASYTEGGEEYFVEEEDLTELAVDYYFNRNISLGAVFADAAETSYGVRSEVFFTELFRVGAEYVTADSDNVATIYAGLRF